MFRLFFSAFRRSARGSAFALLCLCACTASVGSDPIPVGDAVMAPVEQLIGTAACSTDADCSTIALGEKACGGPLLYRAWSSRGTDPQALASAAARYTATQRARSEASGMASNCVRVDDPGARCMPTGRCELARDRGNAVR